MRAALLWTISDLPARGNVEGWKIKGRAACPCCKMGTRSRWLKHSRKFCYSDHRRYLPKDHKYRKDKINFYGTIETGLPPPFLSGSDLWNQVSRIENRFGKDPCPRRKRVRLNTSMMKLPGGWKKRSIFFELPYWEHLLLRHNLDLMHIEKNVCDSIIGTIMQIKGKSKDTEKSRLDLEGMGIRKRLHLAKNRKRKRLPPSYYTMSSWQKDTFCEVIKSVKLPFGYASNISRCVNSKERKLQGLKSHDCHVLMQQILPLALRITLPKKVRSVLIDLCRIFRDLCSKAFDVVEFEQIEARTIMTLCELERIFPPSFFDVMVHLIVHLADEARIAGPVHYRWMYPIERYLGHLKSYVRNRSRPEGSIAEGYLAEECLNFCSLFLEHDDAKPNESVRECCSGDVSRNQSSSIFSPVGHSLGKIELTVLDRTTWLQVHRYMLFNSDVTRPFIEEYHQFLRLQMPRARKMVIDRRLQENFHTWFSNKVEGLDPQRYGSVLEELKRLARGPNYRAKRMKGFVMNGVKFHTKTYRPNKQTQTSGVMVKAKTLSYSSSKDKNPSEEVITYYGVLTDILELDYYSNYKVVLFKCDWVDIDKGKEEDEHGFTLVDFSKLCHTGEKLSDDPFVLACQAEQVFYVEDPIKTGWHVVNKAILRGFYDTLGPELLDDDILWRKDDSITRDDHGDGV